jgi:hypothetical protein
LDYPVRSVWKVFAGCKLPLDNDNLVEAENYHLSPITLDLEKTPISCILSLRVGVTMM